MTAQHRNPVSFARIVFALGCLLTAATSSHAQSVSPTSYLSQSSSTRATPVAPELMALQSARLFIRANAARQRALVGDADRLLALARALNAGVREDGTPLTASQRLKLANEIEKLARSVKERMTYAYYGGPELAGPMLGWTR